MKFSGHDTFACRTPWLYKGLELLHQQVTKQKDLSILSKAQTTVSLGVGKNMLNAIKHWLLAFGIVDDKSLETTLIASLIYHENEEEALDLFIEDRFTLWLLHYEICHREYATIYHYFFKEYFKRKSTRTFSETEFINNLRTWIQEQNLLNAKLENRDKPIALPAENSLRADFRCLVDTYCIKTGKNSTYEDNYTTLLGELELIKRTELRSEAREQVYEINFQAALNEAPSLFATLLLKEFGQNASESIDAVYSALGTTLLMNREDFSSVLETVTQDYSSYFSFRSDAGVQELQINCTLNWFQFALEKYYRA